MTRRGTCSTSSSSTAPRTRASMATKAAAFLSEPRAPSGHTLRVSFFPDMMRSAANFSRSGSGASRRQGDQTQRHRQQTADQTARLRAESQLRVSPVRICLETDVWRDARMTESTEIPFSPSTPGTSDRVCAYGVYTRRPFLDRF
jgi:hypothetical protein